MTGSLYSALRRIAMFKPHLPLPFTMWAGLSVAALLGRPVPGMAQPVADGTAGRITDVTLYPGAATLERVAPVAAGARQLQLSCLPASFDADSLRVEAPASIRIGDITTRTAPRSRSEGCGQTPLDKRIAEIEDQIAAIDAEAGGADLALGFLKGLAQGAAPAAAGRAPGSSASIGDIAQVVSITGQANLLKQHQLARRKEALTVSLAPLLADRDRLQRPDAPVRSMTIRLSAASAGELRLRYQIRGPGWSPSYRASLDTGGGMVRLERLAQVAQASGEDWRGVKLRLSTGQPGASAAAPMPLPWQVGIAMPAEPRLATDSFKSARSAAAAPPAALAPAAEPSFDISVFQGSYATEFEVPGTVDLASGEQRLTLSLGAQELKSEVRTRTTPHADAHAYLVADIARPTGVWLGGPLQLYRDGAFTGSARWVPAEDDKVSLPFGRDDLVRVQVEPERTLAGSAGFTGSKTERQIGRAYSVQNLHTSAIRLEVLEATPVSTDESVVVTQRLTPPPTTTSWQKQPGVAQWESTLGAGMTARFTADYTLTAPKDARVTGWR